MKQLFRQPNPAVRLETFKEDLNQFIEKLKVIVSLLFCLHVDAIL
jgi:hypothetical protein